MSHIHWVPRGTGPSKFDKIKRNTLSCRLSERQDNPVFELLSESRATEVE